MLKIEHEIRISHERQPLADVLEVFIGIAQNSNDIIQDWKNGDRAIEEKININGAIDVVTIVDRDIEQMAIRELTDKFPGIGIIGEESFCQKFATTREGSYFVIDPIDGTAQFVQRGDEWSISICQVVEGKPEVAVVYMPDKNQMFTAIRGEGVYLNGLLLEPQIKLRDKIIGVSPRQIKDDIYRSRIKLSSYLPYCISALTPKVCALLKGDIDAAIYFEQAGKSAALWDYAAVYLLIHEYGGRMTSLCGASLPFRGRGVIHTKGWLATASASDYQCLLENLGGNCKLSL